MYGMVNSAIRDLVIGAYGQERWRKIHRAAGAEEDFGKMDAYPDEVTYRLIAAASKELQARPEEIMHAFGEYWVLVTAEQGYGELLDSWGRSFVEFVGNLDNLHARVAQTFADLKPPSFRVENLPDGQVRIHYISHRTGLAPFVVGLLSGLGKRFDTPVEITHERSKSDGADHDVFLVRC